MPDLNLQPLVQQGWTALHPILTSFVSGIKGAAVVSLVANSWLVARVKGGVESK